MSRRVAVIGVHGVGETMRGAMPQSLVTLLGRTGQFGVFTKQDLTIRLSADGLGVKTVKPSTDIGVAKDQPSVGDNSPFAGFSGIFRADLVPDNQPPDIDFTKTLLTDGNVSEAAHDVPPTYRTEMWSGRREAPGRPATHVDIFEMYWSDLSHPATNSGLGIFNQFVQLLVHLASIGRISAETMLAGLYQLPAAGARTLALWEKFTWLNKAFYWLLSIPLVVGNLGLILLAVLFIALAGLPAADLPLWRGGIYGGSAFLLGMAGALWRMAPPPPVLRAASVLAVIGLSVWFGVWAATRALPLWPFIVLALVLAGEFLMRPYQSMRPGALGLWRGLAAVLGAAILLGAAWGTGAGPGDDRWWLAGVLRAAHGLFDTLLFCWLGYCALLLALLALGGVLWWCAPDEARDGRGRAICTCWLAALLPAPLLIGFVLGGLALLGGEFAGVLGDSQTWIAAHPGAHCGGTGPACPSVYAAVGQWLMASGTVAFLTYSLVVFTALVLAAVALAPCVLSELFPLAGRLRGFSGNDGLRDWLDGAFHLMVPLGFVVVLLLLPIMADGATVAWRGVIGPLFGAPAGAAPTVLLPLQALNGLVNDFSPLITMFGPAAVATTTGLLAASKALAGRAEAVWKSFSNVFNRLRVTIDTIQDVDNWLRERPTTTTVRFQVFARYASLLRHIETAGGGDYEDIVIVAYSQGTIVTTDYLRYVQYLHTKGPLRNATAPRPAEGGAAPFVQTMGAPGPDGRAAVPHLPVSLLTLGCPLRQLYRARFPVLYGWFDPARPDATALKLGVKRWRNLYGSGDYVGRDLWTAPGTRVAEACIGPQAHTRYFDSAPADVATVVAATLNELI